MPASAPAPAPAQTPTTQTQPCARHRSCRFKSLLSMSVFLPAIVMEGLLLPNLHHRSGRCLSPCCRLRGFLGFRSTASAGPRAVYPAPRSRGRGWPGIQGLCTPHAPPHPAFLLGPQGGVLGEGSSYEVLIDVNRFFEIDFFRGHKSHTQ